MSEMVACQDCGHDIDIHDLAGGCEEDLTPHESGWTPCLCDLPPSGVARLLIHGIPSESPAAPVGVFGAEDEQRVTDDATGGQKGRKAAQVSTLDPAALYALATVGGDGAAKYEAHNYRRGYAWSLSYDAMMRHALKFWAGEDLDPESGRHHMLHAAFHCLALYSFMRDGVGTDDRYMNLNGS